MFPNVWNLKNMPSWQWETVEFFEKKKKQKKPKNPTPFLCVCTARIGVLSLRECNLL